MESETSTVIGAEGVGLGQSEAGPYEPIVTHNAATASGEPTAVVISPAEQTCTSAEAGTTTTIYTLMVEASTYDGNSTEESSDQISIGVESEPISVPILSSSVLEPIDLTTCDIGQDTTHHILVMRTSESGVEEGGIWIPPAPEDNSATDPTDITRKACVASNIGPEDMGTDVVAVVNTDTQSLLITQCSDSVGINMCVDKNDIDCERHDHDSEIHIIEVVDDISERPDSTMTIESESSSTSLSSDSYERKTDSRISMDTENDTISVETGSDSKRTPNRTPICSDSFPAIRIPPPITRTPLPNLPGIKGTSLAASQPVISKAIDSTAPLGSGSRVSCTSRLENGNSGPILHSVSSMLLKRNESCSNDTALVRPIPQVRPCFNAFAGVNHQLLPAFHFPHQPPNVPLPLPPLTVFASPIRIFHPNLPLSHAGIPPIPPLSSSSLQSSIGLPGTLSSNLPPHIRLIPPPFATTGEPRRIVRRRRNSSNSKSSEEDPESQKVRRRQANARERDRVTQLNTGFEQLRRVLPWVQQGRRTSKVDTLRAAISYIDHLQRVLWDADHAGYLGGAVAVGPSLTSDICKFVEFRPTFGMLPPPPALCIGAAERREMERNRLVASEAAMMKGSAQTLLGESGLQNPALRWLTEFQETLRRLPKPIEPSPRRLLSEVDGRPRIVVVESDRNNNIV